MRNLYTGSISIIAGILTSMLATGCMDDGPADTTDPVTDVAESALTGTDVITQVGFTITTGSDDKRSDSHVFIEVDLTNGNQLMREIGANQTWPNGTTVGPEYIDLPNGIQNNQIATILVWWRHGGGSLNADNWNMNALQITARDQTTGALSLQMQMAGNPLLRFTSHATVFSRPYVQ